MRKCYDILAFVYEADYHCGSCARKRFGSRLEQPDTEDSEGNRIGALFASSEWFNVGEGNQVLRCSDCGCELDTYSEEEAAI
jgi:hypothetical protein